ncbi:MAG: hypothetical protein EXS06_09260 [Planctomycetaceae bacterium]|nr:hypothetical protein [Planctomycetaceae bacterium]
MSHRLTMLLEGKVGYVIGGLRRLRDDHGLKGEKLKRLNAAITYYENNREYMKYDDYLAAGYPIGSGVAKRRLPTSGRRPDGRNGHAVDRARSLGNASPAGRLPQRPLG